MSREIDARAPKNLRARDKVEIGNRSSRRTQIVKSAETAAAIGTGAVLANFTEPPLQFVGLAILAGVVLYPIGKLLIEVATKPPHR